MNVNREEVREPRGPSSYNGPRTVKPALLAGLKGLPSLSLLLLPPVIFSHDYLFLFCQRSTANSSYVQGRLGNAIFFLS